MNFLFGAAFSVFKYVTAVSILMLLSAYLAGIRLADNSIRLLRPGSSPVMKSVSCRLVSRRTNSQSQLNWD